MTDSGAALRRDWLTTPYPSRFNGDDEGSNKVLEAHQAAVDAGQGGYFDPHSGLFVMTALQLKNRGWCCDLGCRHCPYVGAEQQPEKA